MPGLFDHVVCVGQPLMRESRSSVKTIHPNYELVDLKFIAVGIAAESRRAPAESRSILQIF